MATSPKYNLDFPECNVLTAMGRLTIVSGHLEHVLKMTVKSLKKISIIEALQDTKKKSSRVLRSEIIKIAEEKLGKGEALDELKGFINRAWKAAEKRNRYVHNVWARNGNNELLMQNDDLSWRIAPAKEEIDNLTNEIANIRGELNGSRLQGNLADAIKKFSI